MIHLQAESFLDCSILNMQMSWGKWKMTSSRDAYL